MRDRLKEDIEKRRVPPPSNDNKMYDNKGDQEEG